MINWVPCHANKKMLTDTLRDRFGLDGGYIGSDNENVEFLAHGAVPTVNHGHIEALAMAFHRDVQ